MVRAYVPWTSSQARTQREQTMHLLESNWKYGLVETDADFFHLVVGDRPKFAATHLVHFAYDGNQLFDAPESQFFQIWGKSDLKGRAKWRRWDNY